MFFIGLAVAEGDWPESVSFVETAGCSISSLYQCLCAKAVKTFTGGVGFGCETTVQRGFKSQSKYHTMLPLSTQRCLPRNGSGPSVEPPGELPGGHFGGAEVAQTWIRAGVWRWWPKQ